MEKGKASKTFVKRDHWQVIRCAPSKCKDERKSHTLNYRKSGMWTLLKNGYFLSFHT